MALRRIGYACIAFMFMHSGAQAAMDPGVRTAKAAALGVPDPELAVRANGALMTAAGAALALGFRPRLAAGLLAALLVPTTIAGHPFWTEPKGAARKGMVTQFLKNLSMFGGLLVVLSQKDAD
ncbi:MAG: DoxX family membrane protein [Thermomicrobiales bacterium]|nr:DoxX family membrane protein [Thermomicrobiales bacterium]